MGGRPLDEALSTCLRCYGNSALGGSGAVAREKFVAFGFVELIRGRGAGRTWYVTTEKVRSATRTSWRIRRPVPS